MHLIVWCSDKVVDIPSSISNVCFFFVELKVRIYKGIGDSYLSSLNLERHQGDFLKRIYYKLIIWIQII